MTICLHALIQNIFLGGWGRGREKCSGGPRIVFGNLLWEFNKFEFFGGRGGGSTPWLSRSPYCLRHNGHISARKIVKCAHLWVGFWELLRRSPVFCGSRTRWPVLSRRHTPVECSSTPPHYHYPMCSLSPASVCWVWCCPWLNATLI